MSWIEVAFNENLYEETVVRDEEEKGERQSEYSWWCDKVRDGSVFVAKSLRRKLFSTSVLPKISSITIRRRICNFIEFKV